MKGIKHDMLGRKARLPFYRDFLYEVDYSWSVILNRKPYSLHALAKKVEGVLGPGK